MLYGAPAIATPKMSLDYMRNTQVSTLTNGIRVVTEAMPHLESASIGLWFDVGARHERRDEHGLSHLLEHMIFKGTRLRSARRIAEEIEDVGGYLNAFTTRDTTTVFAKVLSADLPLAIDLLADITQNASFDAQELAREREVILQEIGQAKDTPDDIVFDLLQEIAFPGQPLGRSILGTEKTVAAFTRQCLLDYRERHYCGRNLVVAAAGDVSHADIVARVEEAFVGLEAGVSAGFDPARYRGGEHRDERETEQLHLTIAFPGTAFDDPDYYAMQVFATMLGGGMSSRLFQTVREERGLAYSIYSFPESHRDTGLLGLYAGTAPEMAGELVELIAREVKSMAETVTREETDRARAQLKAGLLMSLESTSARVEQLGRQMLIFGRPIGLEEMVEKVEAVDGDAARRVGERLLGAERISLATVGPAGSLPDYQQISRLFS